MLFRCYLAVVSLIAVASVAALPVRRLSVPSRLAHPHLYLINRSSNQTSLFETAAATGTGGGTVVATGTGDETAVAIATGKNATVAATGTGDFFAAPLGECAFFLEMSSSLTLLVYSRIFIRGPDSNLRHHYNPSNVSTLLHVLARSFGTCISFSEWLCPNCPIMYYLYHSESTWWTTIYAAATRRVRP